MASVTFFVRFVAIVLLVVSIVYCDWVGHGRHELINGKIVKLRGNTKIAEKPEDLELYKNKVGSCDVEMDKDGNITIWYLKNSITAKEGCSIDFAMSDLRRSDKFFIEFGIQHDKKLTDCLADMSSTKLLSLNQSAMTSNSLAIAFGLKNGEFEGVKRGYPERHKNYCGDLSECHNKGGRCLDVADYTIGWTRNGDKVKSTHHPIGETNYGYCDIRKDMSNEHEAAGLHVYDKEFRGCGDRKYQSKCIFYAKGCILEGDPCNNNGAKCCYGYCDGSKCTTCKGKNQICDEPKDCCSKICNDPGNEPGMDAITASPGGHDLTGVDESKGSIKVCG
uniref:Uncharacterized protein n=1 Tax=Meloidogyne javanica TaxID=6303 RepID=A0A915MWA5_MELJA